MTVVPKKALGQHFLVDRNLLGVIGRLSELGPDDAVLEVGPGLGILTRYLAERVRHVHAVELDSSLEEPLRDALAGHANVELTFGDALTLDLDRLAPHPNKLVANLPYNVATPIVVETVIRSPEIERWCVMVQREVADRFFATPSTKAYGAVSVMLKLCTSRIGFHAVPATAFRPPPKVESAIVAFERIAAPDLALVRPVVTGAFAHRRKTLANSLALAGVVSREQAVEALLAMGARTDARAEQLEPHEFVALAEALR